MSDQLNRKPEIGDFILRAESYSSSSAQLVLYRIASLDPTWLEEVIDYPKLHIRTNKKKQLLKYVIVELPWDIKAAWEKLAAGQVLTPEEKKCLL
jgi:hypothetical protein